MKQLPNQIESARRAYRNLKYDGDLGRMVSHAPGRIHLPRSLVGMMLAAGMLLAIGGGWLHLNNRPLSGRTAPAGQPEWRASNGHGQLTQTAAPGEQNLATRTYRPLWPPKSGAHAILPNPSNRRFELLPMRRPFERSHARLGNRKPRELLSQGKSVRLPSSLGSGSKTRSRLPSALPKRRTDYET